MTNEPPTTTGVLARLGFSSTDRVRRFLADPALAGLGDGAAEALGRTADGDAAVLGLLRLAEAARDRGQERLLGQFLAGIGESPAPRTGRRGSGGGRDPREAGRGRDRQDPAEGGAAPRSPGQRLITLLGASVALGDFLTRHPEHLTVLLEGDDELTLSSAQVRQDLLEAVGADPLGPVPIASDGGREVRDALRIAYHARLTQIAAADLGAADPSALQPRVSAALSDLADAALEAAAAIARATVDGQDLVRWAVIALGKTGARELNFLSDVDVMHVVAPAASAAPEPAAEATAAEGDRPGGTDAQETGGSEAEEEVGRIGAALARELARACSERTAEGALWQVDANLRPEGQDGPLVRTLASYRRYYTEWAKSWEFQALLKARAAAGDPELGAGFEEMVQPWVWQASTRDGFVEDARAMRRRVVAHIPRAEVDRNLKLGPGGLRDVEFTVQLLQMVHGRADPVLQGRSTLEALARLGEGGYISRRHVAEMDEAYRFLRCVEHRMQLHRLRRTQVLPTAASDLRRLARSLGLATDDFHQRYQRTRRRVKQLHEEIFYRPLLLTASQLSDGEIRLSQEDAAARLAAIGYRDPARALGHIAALTDGISRRAKIQRQLLPAMLEWFADGVDPDLGLLSFRRLSDEIGSAHWYLGLLRDSGLAAKRLTRVLASGRYVGEQLEQIPEGVRWLARDEQLRPLTRDVLGREFLAVISRVDDAETARDLLRRTRGRELLRIALAHLTDVASPREVATALTDLAEAVLEAGLLVAQHVVAREREVVAEGTEVLEEVEEVDEGTAARLRERRSDPARALGIEMVILAQGSFGAREMGYSSDADVQFIVVDRGAGRDAVEIAIAVASQVQKILNAPTARSDMRVSADLRPEGRMGPLARSLESWCEYYRRDAETWEKQALLRARPVVASEALAARLTEEMDHHRYPAGGLSPTARREITRMKARVESERLPRGADPSRHVKLGRGGMSDVEWSAQLLALEHGHEVDGLRTERTLVQLEAAGEAGLLPAREVRELTEAWMLAWLVRRTLFLWKGREGDVLPSDRNDLRALAMLIDGEDGSAHELEERYLRLTRRARSVAEQVIFGEDG